MLDNLLEMEVAMRIIEQEEKESKEDTKEGQENTKDPFDKHYEKLHCSMEVILFFF